MHREGAKKKKKEDDPTYEKKKHLAQLCILHVVGFRHAGEREDKKKKKHEHGLRWPTATPQLIMLLAAHNLWNEPGMPELRPPHHKTNTIRHGSATTIYFYVTPSPPTHTDT